MSRLCGESSETVMHLSSGCPVLAKSIVPIVLGGLGTVPAKLSKSLEKLEIDDVIGSLQTAVLISTTAILRRILNLYGPG